MPEKPIPNIRTILGTLELVPVLCIDNLRDIVFRLAGNRLLDKILDVALLNLKVPSHVVGARPESKATDTQLVAVIPETKRHPLRLCLHVIVLLVCLLAEGMPDVVQVRVDVLQANGDVYPLSIVREPVCRKIIHVIAVVLAKRFCERLLVDDTGRRGIA